MNVWFAIAVLLCAISIAGLVVTNGPDESTKANKISMEVTDMADCCNEK